MIAALLLAGILDIVKVLLIVFFALSAVLLIAVILLQEGKGGGLAQAFGGAGAETFGVQAGSVNKFTAIVVGVFMGLAVLYAAIPEERDKSTVERVMEQPVQAPSGGEKPPG